MNKPDGLMITKHLGKIENINIGISGYQDAMFGLTINFVTNNFNVSTFISAGWVNNLSENLSNKLTDRLSLLLVEAKKKNMSELKGTPVEVQVNKDGSFNSFRILTEVL